MEKLTAELSKQFKKSEELENKTREIWQGLVLKFEFKLKESETLSYERFPLNVKKN